jgi:GTPase SAR1 family protein
VLRARQPTTSIIEYKYKINGAFFLFVDVGGQRSERRKWINCFENVSSLLFVASLHDYDLSLSVDEVRSSMNATTLATTAAVEQQQTEHEKINRMRDALDLFRTLINWKKKTFVSVGNSKGGSVKPKSGQRPQYSVQAVRETLLFERVSIILFLNKEDLFDEKIKTSSPRACFNDYDDSLSPAEAKEFIARKFLACEVVNNKRSQLSSPAREIYWHYTYALDRKNIETVIASVKDRILKQIFDSMRL